MMKLDDTIYRQLLENASSGTAMLDGRGAFIDADEAFCEFCQKDSVGLRHTQISDLIGHRDVVQNSAAIAMCVKTGRPQRLTVHWRRPDRSPLSVSLSYVRPTPDMEMVAMTVFPLPVVGEPISPPNSAKAVFGAYLGKMGHEFRTPMNGIIGMSGLLMESGLTKEQEDFAKTIKQSAMALLSVVNDLMDLSKIQFGELAIESASFDLRRVIRDIDEELGVAAESRGLSYHTRVDERLDNRFIGDAGRLRQVVVELAGNAVKFTQRGNILVDYRLESSSERVDILRVEVTDTGVEIEPDRLAHLFDEFVDDDNPASRGYGGAGLGFFIAKTLVELMGGTIGARSVADGGVTFYFMVPLAKCTQIEPLAPKTSTLPKQTRLLVCNPNIMAVLAESDLLRQRDVGVELEVDAAKVLRLLHNAHAAGNAYSACLISMDATYANGDGSRITGRDLGENIKRTVGIAGTVVVMLTEHGIRGDVADIRKAGLDVYLQWPARAVQVLDAIELAGRREGADNGTPPVVTRHTVAVEKKREAAILLVEDNVVNQKVALKMLEKLGYGCDLAQNGLEATKLLADRRYDVVLMDIQMPVMDGFAATRTIRDGRSPVRDHLVPIIAMTAHTNEDDRDAYLEAGMNDFIFKPISLMELDKVIERWLNVSPSVPNESPEEASLFNRAQLLEQLVGDEDIFQQIVASFVTDVTEQLDRLKEAVNNRALDETRQLAKMVYSASGDVAAKAMFLTAREIEQAARFDNYGRLCTLVDKLEEQFRRTRQELAR